MAVWLLLGAQACGDDQSSSADAGSDAADGGPEDGPSGGRSGQGGARAGSEPRAGTGGSGATPDSGSAADGGGTGEEPTGRPITLQFKATLGDAELECGSQYPDQGSTRVRATPQDFRMFVERVTLITADGREAPVRFDARAPFQTEQVALLDFTNGRGACLVGAASTNTTITGHVDEGDYTAIEFVNGVPEALNHQNITMLPPPLQDGSTFWGWRSGYRFIMAELLPTSAPEDDAGTTDIGTASFVHIGSVGCSGTNAEGFTCTRPNRNRIRLDGFDPDTSVIVADLGQVFAAVDLASAVECHGPGPECAPMYAALGVDLANGEALETQTVFRLQTR